MTTTYLYPTFLVLHLTALLLFAGMTLGDYLAYTSFWKSFGGNERPEALLNFMAKIPRLAGIGAALLILSGIGMMALTRGVYGEQFWFQIKFGLVILVILNSLLIGRRQGNKLQRILATGGLVLTDEVSRIKSRLNRFHLLQLLFFLIIIFLSVFKFN
jgi:uncharacterized membrane protein SirB2